MIGTIICKISTIIYNIDIINLKFYLLKISYLYEYGRINLFLFFFFGSKIGLFLFFETLAAIHQSLDND